MNKSECRKNFYAGMSIGILFGVSVGFLLSNAWHEKVLAEVDIHHKSLEISSGMSSFLLNKILLKGDIEYAKSYLVKDYEEAKAMANKLKIEEYSAKGWPFSVSQWHLEEIEKSIKRINNPDRCSKQEMAFTKQSPSTECNG